jgi:hypothetical protein
MNKSKVAAINDLVRTHIDRRGLQGIASKSAFENAIEDLYTSERVMIVTGFLVRDCMIGETDGPIGALSLAHALENMGKEVMLLTDQFSQQMIFQGISVLGLDAEMVIIPFIETEDFLSEKISSFNPSHIIAIERPGAASDGCCYSMNGEDLSSLIPKADYLFDVAHVMGIKTIAIGDGGNEMGMGSAFEYISSSVLNGEIIASMSRADHLIVAGVSNWGGYGLAAGLSLRTGRLLMHNEADEERIMSTIIACGAVDGVTKKTEPSVDGYSFEENMGIFKKIREIAKELC